MMNASVELQQLFSDALRTLGFSDVSIELQHPNDLAHGDYTTNVAMQLAKVAGTSARDTAHSLVEHIRSQKVPWIQNIEVAGPGFINVFFTPVYLSQQLSLVSDAFGKNMSLAGKKVIVEYTDPNPFKVLHIGHLMSNTIGESLSRVFEWSGAQTMRACYQGDVGMHVAKSLWGILQEVDTLPKNADLSAQVAYLGAAYARGSAAFDGDDENVKNEIKAINKHVYRRDDQKINDVYDWGRQVSLDYFETQYKKLGTWHAPEAGKAFNYYFFESNVAPIGEALVREYLEKGVFVRSEGAVVFPGEDHGLHTRVFLNSEDLPTYEAKELGLAQVKYEAYPYDISVVVTGNEVNQYFAVLLKVLSIIYPEIAKKTVHIGHGMLRLPSGKMSSRTGTVVSAEGLLAEVAQRVRSRDERAMSSETIMMIAIAAIKYSILRQTAGKDIIFDIDTSLSFEGDSGPYLQYAFVRCQSVLRKATEVGLVKDANMPTDWQTTDIERLIYRFPEVVLKSREDFSVHFIANFLINLAQAFHSWYGKTKIVDMADPSAPYKLFLVCAVAQTLKNGLWLLGIEAPDNM